MLCTNVLERGANVFILNVVLEFFYDLDSSLKHLLPVFAEVEVLVDLGDVLNQMGRGRVREAEGRG